MTSDAPGFVVLYRFRLRPGREAEFVDAWSEVTGRMRREHGSLGSRLHRGDDGLWYAYAQWPSAAHREQAFASPGDPATSARMREAILEALPEVRLEPVAGHLV